MIDKSPMGDLLVRDVEAPWRMWNEKLIMSSVGCMAEIKIHLIGGPNLIAESWRISKQSGSLQRYQSTSFNLRGELL